MKINSKINKQVNEAVFKCRISIIEATIQLLKQIGTGHEQDVMLDHPLVLFQREKNGTMRTLILESVSYCETDSYFPYLVLSFDGIYHTSYHMSLTSLQTIYEEVRKVVRKY